MNEQNTERDAGVAMSLSKGHDAEKAARAIEADALREAADGLYLSRPGQHNEGAKDWLHRRANLLDPRTRDTVCHHGNPKASACGYCETDLPYPPGEGGAE